MTKAEEATKIILDIKDLERKMKIMELEMQLINHQSAEALTYLQHDSSASHYIEKVYNLTEKYLL